MLHHMKLQPDPFDKIVSGKKTIELRLSDDKRKLVNPGDQIIFSNIDNPFRTIKVDVESLIKAPSFEKLFDYIPLVECGFESQDKHIANISMEKYYTLIEQQSYGVVGIKFSVDHYRSLSEIKLPLSEVEKYILSSISSSENDTEFALPWFSWHKAKARVYVPDNIKDILVYLDDSVDNYIDFLSEKLAERADEAGYNTVDEYLDRPFDAHNFFDIYKWWKNIRYNIIEFYCGGYQLRS